MAFSSHNYFLNAWVSTLANLQEMIKWFFPSRSGGQTLGSLGSLARLALFTTWMKLILNLKLVTQICSRNSHDHDCDHNWLAIWLLLMLWVLAKRSPAKSRPLKKSHIWGKKIHTFHTLAHTRWLLVKHLGWLAHAPMVTIWEAWGGKCTWWGAMTSNHKLKF